MKGKILGAFALGAAVGAYTLYKIGEKELEERAVTEENLDDDFDALFDEDDEDIEVFDDEEVTLGDIASDAVESAKEVGKTIKVGYDKSKKVVKEQISEYKEDPEAYKEKAKDKAKEYKDKAMEFAADKVEDVKDFASDKYESAKDFINEKINNLADDGLDDYDDDLEFEEVEEKDEKVEEIIKKGKDKK